MLRHWRSWTAAVALILVPAAAGAQVERIELDIAGYLCGFWVFNVKAAVSRLDFGPAPKEMEVTDIASGHFVFRPVDGEEVSFAALDEAIRNAGYEIEDAVITVAGTVTDERRLQTPGDQLFHLAAAGEPPGAPLRSLEPGRKATVRGAWTAAEGVEVVEVTDVGDDGDGEEGPEPDEPGGDEGGGAARR